MRIHELQQKHCPPATPFTNLLLLTFLASICAACTTVGTHHADARDAIDFGPREELRICILADEGITEDHARQLIGEVGKEFSVFGLDLSVPWVRQWKRPAFLMEGIVEKVWQEPLEAPCDRLLALVGRTVGDFLWGLFGPEVLGAVDTPTHSRGYVVARTVSLNQLISSPTEIAAHEFYHFLGCHHKLSLTQCYTHITELKRIAHANREAGSDFFPGVSLTGAPIRSRHETNLVMTNAVRLALLERHEGPTQP